MTYIIQLQIQCLTGSYDLQIKQSYITTNDKFSGHYEVCIMQNESILKTLKELNNISNTTKLIAVH